MSNSTLFPVENTSPNLPRAEEVEFLNVGSAQTLQFDCVATSQNPVPTEERRIKLPPVTGPALGAIAEAVVAAQESRAGEAASHPTMSDSVDMVGEGPEPTLRLDSKALKREHARLAAQDNTALRQGRFTGGLRSLVAMGSVAAIAVALTLLGMGRFHSPADSNPTSAAVTPPVTAASLPMSSTSPSPASTRAPAAVEAVQAPSASVVSPPVSHAQRRGTGGAPPAVHLQAKVKRPQAKSGRRMLVSETFWPSPRRREPSVAVGSRPISRRPPRSHMSQSNPLWSDEDTFATHHRASHADNAGEWTDRIP